MKVRYFLLIPAFILLYFTGRTQNDLNGPLGSAFAMSRRADLQAQLTPGSCAVVFSGGLERESQASNIPRPFFPLPNFYYLTGLQMPDAVLVMFAEPQKFEEGESKEFLFVPGKGDMFMQAMDEHYVGKMGLQPGGWVVRPASEWRKFCIDVLGSEKVKQVLASEFIPSGFQRPGELSYQNLAHSLFSNLPPRFPFRAAAQRYYREIRGVDSAGLRPLILKVNAYQDYFSPLGRDPLLDEFVQVTEPEALKAVQAQIGSIKLDLIRLEEALRGQRLVKSETERAVLRRCAKAVSDALAGSSRALKADAREKAVAAKIRHALERTGCDAGASVRVASGPRSARPFYNRNHAQMPDQGFVVLDVAARLEGYFARVTRTLPIGGTFSAAQKQIYDRVAVIHGKALAACKPGAAPSKIVGLALPAFDRLLEELAVATNRRGKSMIVRTVNLAPVGLSISTLENPASLAAGMTFVLESALYIPDDSRINAKWRGMGIVFRDVIEITSSGAVVLTKASEGR